MTILGHLWIKDETTNLSEHLLRTDWLLLTQKWLLTSRFPLVKAKQFGWTQGRWPKKSAEFLLHMLKNAESNAELKVWQQISYFNSFLLLID